MEKKRFDYQKKDLPAIKKELGTRLLFVLLFFAVFAWQFGLLLYSNHKNLNTTLFTVISIFVMIISLLFIAVGFVYVFKYFKMTYEIKKNGHYVASLSLFSTMKSDSFIKLYSIISKIILVLMFAVLVGAVTYQVLQYIYYSTIMIYLPLIAMFALIAFNGVSHINFEIKTSEKVEVYHSPY